MNNDRVEELKDRVERLSLDLEEAKIELKAAQDEAAPFKVGDTVEAKRRGLWCPAIVRSVEHHSFGIWYRVSFAKKNGQWSSQVVNATGDVRQVPGEGGER